MTVTVIIALGLFMLGKAKMIIKLSIEGCLYSHFGEHLPEYIKVFFGFDIFSGLLGYRLEFFLIHSAYPLPWLGLMIGSYTDLATISLKSLLSDFFYLYATSFRIIFHLRLQVRKWVIGCRC